MILFPLGVFPDVDCMVVLFLILLPFILFSIVAAPIYVPTSRAGWLHPPYGLASTDLIIWMIAILIDVRCHGHLMYYFI